MSKPNIERFRNWIFNDIGAKVLEFVPSIQSVHAHTDKFSFLSEQIFETCMARAHPYKSILHAQNHDTQSTIGKPYKNESAFKERPKKIRQLTGWKENRARGNFRWLDKKTLSPPLVAPGGHHQVCWREKVVRDSPSSGDLALQVCFFHETQSQQRHIILPHSQSESSRNNIVRKNSRTFGRMTETYYKYIIILNFRGGSL